MSLKTCFNVSCVNVIFWTGNWRNREEVREVERERDLTTTKARKVLSAQLRKQSLLAHKGFFKLEEIKEKVPNYINIVFKLIK